MSKYNQTTTVCVNYGAPTITPIDRFIASTATEPFSNLLKTTEPCTII